MCKRYEKKVAYLSEWLSGHTRVIEELEWNENDEEHKDVAVL